MHRASSGRPARPSAWPRSPVHRRREAARPPLAARRQGLYFLRRAPGSPRASAKLCLGTMLIRQCPDGAGRDGGGRRGTPPPAPAPRLRTAAAGRPEPRTKWLRGRTRLLRAAGVGRPARPPARVSGAGRGWGGRARGPPLHALPLRASVSAPVTGPPAVFSDARELKCRQRPPDFVRQLLKESPRPPLRLRAGPPRVFVTPDSGLDFGVPQGPSAWPPGGAQ